MLGIRLLTCGSAFVRRLNSLLHTKQWGYQMEGWLNAYQEGGWLPSWSAPGDRGAMTGNMQDASVAAAGRNPGGGLPTPRRASPERAAAPHKHNGPRNPRDRRTICSRIRAAARAAARAGTAAAGPAAARAAPPGRLRVLRRVDTPVPKF